MTMLPPGTLQALKKSPDAVVVVVLASLGRGAAALGVQLWGVLSVLVACLGGYHLRASGAERHARETARIKVEAAAAEVELVKARHRDLLAQAQPALPLGKPPGALARKPAARKGARDDG